MSGAAPPGGDQLTGLIAVRWQLVGAALPPLTRCVPTGDLVRRALMSRARELFGPDDLPPPISRHDGQAGGPLTGGEAGMAFLSEDCDGDGRIDHVTAYLAGEIDNASLRALVSLERLWAGRDGEWRVVRTWTVYAGERLGSLIDRAVVWWSLTPFVAPLHNKPRRGLTTRHQLIVQCERAGLPAPVVVEPVWPSCGVPENWFLPHVKGRPEELRGRLGGYWRLVFPTAVWGPIALGFNRHYGMGVFRPVPWISDAR